MNSPSWATQCRQAVGRVGMAATLLCAMAPAQAQLTPERLQPGNARVPFLSALGARPQLQDDAGAPPRWLPHIDNRAAQSQTVARGGVTPDQRSLWEKQIQEMVAALREAPVLSRALGVDYQSSSSMMLVGDEFFGAAGARNAPLSGALNLGAFRHDEVETTPRGLLKTVSGAHTAHFLVSLNLIPSIPPGPWMNDDAGSFFAQTVDGTLDKLPMYGWSLVLTRANRSPYSPVSWSRAVKAFLGSHLKDSNSAAAAREMLNSMSDIERQQPAWVCGDRARWSLEHCFVKAGTPNALPLVVIDPNFFGATLPRTALQIITIDTLNNFAKGSEAGRPNSAFAINLGLFQQVDWLNFRDRFVR